MIAYLQGFVHSHTSDSCILLVNGVGYEVHLARGTGELGEKKSFYIYDFVREDRRELYGFESLEEKNLFEEFLSISGIGAKMAMKVMRAGTPLKILAELRAGNVDFFQSIPGVGKKLAQKMILELRGLLATDEQGISEDTETLDALESLGYARKECVELVSKLQGKTPEERIREALQLMGKTYG